MNHAQALKFLIKRFQVEKKKTLKFIICFFFFFKMRNQGYQEGWASCKEMESEALKDIVYTPQRNQLLFQSGSQKTWIYFIFSFQKCKKILKSAYID